MRARALVSWVKNGGIRVLLLQDSSYKLSSLKQHTCIVSQLLRSRHSLAVLSSLASHQAAVWVCAGAVV